jgi:uncharacterized membrane protein
VRGIAIVIMALDHSRDFFGSLTAQPTNTATATAALFFTRWVTHVCAEVFFTTAAIPKASTFGE